MGVDLGRAAPLVAHFWHTRRDRATAEERDAAFARLFGARPAAGLSFDDAMLEMCEALYKLDEAATNAVYGGIAQQTRVRAAADKLLIVLLGAAGGITVFLAQEILAALHEAIAPPPAEFHCKRLEAPKRPKTLSRGPCNCIVCCGVETRPVWGRRRGRASG